MVLDNQQTKLHLYKAEDILWKASPKQEFHIIWDKHSSYTFYYRLLLVFGVIGIFYLREKGNLEIILTCSLIFVFLLSIPFYILRKYKNSTKFYIFIDGIYIQYLDSFLKEKHEFIPFENMEKVISLSYSKENKDYGFIEISLKKPTSFQYYEYQSRKYWNTPILHNINNIKKVQQIIHINQKKQIS